MPLAGPLLALLLQLALLSRLAPRASACGRRPARVQLPPVQYLRPFVVRKVPCEQYEQLFCANGGRCTVLVKWSVVHSRIEERLDRPGCECTNGYTGFNCDIPVLPSTLDLNTAAFVSVALFVALLVLLLLVVVYLCCAGRTRRRRSPLMEPLNAAVTDTGDGGGVPLVTVAMLASTAFDRTSVNDFIDEDGLENDENWRG